MSVVTLSPLTPESPFPMITAATPAEDQEGVSQPGNGNVGTDTCHRSRDEKPPPVQAGADWQVLLHLPQMEAWLRASAARVTQLTRSVAQDGHNRHVDTHLLQLKDICEDISDHVEQIHALLETEFSLKLLSYSVNIIVDIRTVQLLWHQLRVSVLVLKERLLQGLQDPNGNFTRQTDILQAFSQDPEQEQQHQTRRLDALTEVDDCGQLTIRCSQDYFSLDCGITAYELSDYSPGDEPAIRENQGQDEDATQETDEIQNVGSEKREECELLVTSSDSLRHTHPTAGDINQSEAAKPCVPGDSQNTEPLFPKRDALISDEVKDTRAVSQLKVQTELSHSTIATLVDPIMDPLMDPLDRSKFWLELDSVSQDVHNLKRVHVKTDGKSFGASSPPQQKAFQRNRVHPGAHGNGDSDSSAPSPTREHIMYSDLEASGEESDPRPSPGKMPSRLGKQRGHNQAFRGSSETSPDREHWYGSEEFLALPAQIHKSEILAINLESLARALKPGGEYITHDALQDVDDWDLTELNQENWDSPESGDDVLFPPLVPIRRNPLIRSSPVSSSDIAPSLDESIESGRLSELLSEDEEGRLLGPVALPEDERGSATLVRQLIDDISRDKDPDVWNKMEKFVQQLDGFINWMTAALASTRDWTPPAAHLDALKRYLDTHLTFKLNVDSHCALKESIMEDGTALLATIPAQQSGLRDILEMVSNQWEQLHLQIRRQHAWMLHALRLIRTRLLLHAGQSQQPGETSPPDRLQAELLSGRRDAQRVALQQMAAKLSSLQYTSNANKGHNMHLGRSNSLQELECAYDELWDWLTDVDAMVTDSHQLMMSDEQLEHLFKSSHSELLAMEEKKTSLLGRVESLRRNSEQLPPNFNHKIQQLTHKWKQLEKVLSGLSVGGTQSCRPPETKAELLPAVAHADVLERLQTSVQELKAWLRHTELLIFNSCLRRPQGHARQQLQSFECLCSDVRARRRGVSWVLKVCQQLLQSGPEAEQHREALQLLSINLERRWEAVVMQTLHWQNRLKKELGEQQVPGNFLEASLVDLHQASPVQAPPGTSLPDDSWEWDETDMTITEAPEAPEPDLTHNLPCSETSTQRSLHPHITSEVVPPIYQIYSVHTVEFDSTPEVPCNFSKATKRKQHIFQKSLSKDSTFSSMESLPDLLGGLMPSERRGERKLQREDGRDSGQSSSGRRSESESGIVSDAGDAEMTLCRGIVGDEEEVEMATLMLRTQNQRADEIQRIQRPTEEEKLLTLGKCQSEELENLTKDQDDSDQSTSKFLPGRCLDKIPGLRLANATPILSPGSSLESILSLGFELFPSKEHLHRSASLESGLAVCHSLDGDTSASLVSLTELDLCQTRDGDHNDPDDQRAQGELSSGELSRRTLDLLKRLENIQSPLATKMTRSVSDMTLRSRSPLHRRLMASPVLGGRRSRGSNKALPSLLNESSTSLTELSSAEESSVGSEDLTMLPNHQNLLLDQALAGSGNQSSYRRCCKRSAHREEADNVSLSMVVNVSCTSACTDDEDDSDLLSSSTLTLTEEEIGVQEEEEERLTLTSSGNDDEEQDDEVAMEESYMLGLDYMKKELHAWMRHPRVTSATTSKTEAGLLDELQCGTNPEQGNHLNSSKLDQELHQEEENQTNTARRFISQFLDDVENGNVEQCSLKDKNEDDDLLRDESSVFTKRGDPLNIRVEDALTNRGDLLGESFTFSKIEEDVNPCNQFHSSPSCEFLPPTHGSSLVGQLKGELPCQSASSPPKEGPRSLDRKAITIQEKFKFSSLVTEESRSELRDKHSCQLTKKWKGSHSSSCCQHQLSLPTSPSSDQAKDAVHDFVMEILDLTSEARKSKEIPRQELTQRESDAELRPASFKHIRDKVVQHSHQPLHLRKGDFYAYLSLSSHDSDCGEVTQYAEDKSVTPVPYLISTYATSPTPGPSPDMTTEAKTQRLDLESRDHPTASPGPSLPPSPDIRDEETLFPACTEEVYLGPPLCYSMPPTNKAPKIFQLDGPQPFLENETQLRDSEEGGSIISALPGPTYHGSTLDNNMPTYGKTSKIYKVEDRQPLTDSYEEKKIPEDVHSIVLAVQQPSTVVSQSSPLYFTMPPAQETSKISKLQGPQPLKEEKTPGDLQSVNSTEPEPPYSSFSVNNEVQQALPVEKQDTPRHCLTDPEGVKGITPVVQEPPYSSFSINSKASGEARWREASQLAGCDVSGRQEEARSNEAPSYLNPRARVALIDSSPAQCLADTKTLQSNIGAVMTKISVGGGATNPSKEPPASAAATRINPKINCRPIKEADRAAAGRRGEAAARGGKQPEARTAGRRHQEAKTTTTTVTAGKKKKQVNAVNQSTKAPQGRGHVLVRPIRTGPSGGGTIQVHL
ncbi:A-kinase anchor protein 6 isoform X1 [Corythoichthys intestinalis]|uniref:A-kinase anchor protein 6 isoform X1 n=1 Tax=Corythoichthys intestinalis TaxID=161448 RepID=UPI0025A5B254|nr:A-kinase anchor protein 6 isoform X1 [Corythoichthys intestinalis]